MAKLKGLKVQPPIPTVIEPPEDRVLKAMQAFPDAVTRDRSIRWCKPSEDAAPEWHAPLSRMADILSSDKLGLGSVNGRITCEVIAVAEFTHCESTWAVYRLAERGLLVAGADKTNDGELFWWTTPSLWKWWRSLGVAASKKSKGRPPKVVDPDRKQIVESLKLHGGRISDVIVELKLQPLGKTSAFKRVQRVADAVKQAKSRAKKTA